MPARAQLAWLLTAQPYPTGVHPRGTVSVPPCRSTSAAIAQQRVGLFKPELELLMRTTHERELDGQRAQRERREHARARGVPRVNPPNLVTHPRKG